MGSQTSAQLASCCVGDKGDHELVRYWAWPQRRGMGLDDYQYFYEIPPDPKLLAEYQTKEERIEFERTRQHQYFMLEGKLSFQEYKALVEAFHQDRLVGKGFLENMVQESWVPYEPDNESTSL